MFFDRLFTLTSLKARLLGGSSFSQLYSGERLPLHKFRREGAMLTPLIAGLLAACGGGDGNDVLIGGAGADSMKGGPGADMFVFEGTDYAPNESAPLPQDTPSNFDNFDKIMDYHLDDTIQFTELALKNSQHQHFVAVSGQVEHYPLSERGGRSYYPSSVC